MLLFYTFILWWRGISCMSLYDICLTWRHQTCSHGMMTAFPPPLPQACAHDVSLGRCQRRGDCFFVLHPFRHTHSLALFVHRFCSGTHFCCILRHRHIALVVFTWFEHFWFCCGFAHAMLLPPSAFAVNALVFHVGGGACLLLLYHYCLPRCHAFRRLL